MLDFNFFEPYLDPPSKPNYNRLIWLFLFALVFGLIAYLQFSYYGQKTLAETEINAVRSYISSPEVVGRISKMDEKQNAFQALESITHDLSLFESILSVKGHLQVSVFDQINQQVPEYVFVSAMDLSMTQVQISGYSDSYQSIALFQHQLRQIDLFSDVFVPSITEEQGNYVFNITAPFKVEVPDESK